MREEAIFMMGSTGVAVRGAWQDPFCKSLRQWLECQPALRCCPAAKARLEVLSPGLRRCPMARSAAGGTVIFSSGCAPAAAYAARSGRTPVDVGLSRRDTLTLTSSGEHSAVIALQRPLYTLGGTLLEPMEWPVALGAPCPAELLLCAAAVALLAELPFAFFPPQG